MLLLVLAVCLGRNHTASFNRSTTCRTPSIRSLRTQAEPNVRQLSTHTLTHLYFAVGIFVELNEYIKHTISLYLPFFALNRHTTHIVEKPVFINTVPLFFTVSLRSSSLYKGATIQQYKTKTFESRPAEKHNPKGESEDKFTTLHWRIFVLPLFPPHGTYQR